MLGARSASAEAVTAPSAGSSVVATGGSDTPADGADAELTASGDVIITTNASGGDGQFIVQESLSGGDIIRADSGGVTVTPDLTVSGSTTLRDGLTVTSGGITVASGGLTVSGSTTLRDSLTVSGSTTLRDGLKIGRAACRERV